MGIDELEATSVGWDGTDGSGKKRLDGLRVGIPEGVFRRRIGGRVRKRVMDAVHVLKSWAVLVPVDMPMLNYAIPAYCPGVRGGEQQPVPL